MIVFNTIVTVLTPCAVMPSLSELREAIYKRANVAHYSRGYRTRKLRKVFNWTKGLDLRRKDHVLLAACRLCIISREQTPDHVQAQLFASSDIAVAANRNQSVTRRFFGEDKRTESEVVAPVNPFFTRQLVAAS